MSFARLEQAYHDRLTAAGSWRAAGRPVVGIWGEGAPIELLLASGHMPIAIAPEHPRNRHWSGEWFEAGMDWATDSGLDLLLSGELDMVDLALFVSRAEEDFLLYNSAKEVLRLGAGGALPPLHLYSSLAFRDQPVADYVHGQVRALARRLEAASGERPTPERLAEATRQTNRQRALLRALQALRLKGLMSGHEAMIAIGAGRFLMPEDHAGALADWMRQVETRTVRDGPHILLLSSETLWHDRLHVALEAAGARVVAEDDGWGARAATPDLVLGADPLIAIVEHYRRHTPNRGLYPHDLRLAWFSAQLMAPAIDAVVVHMAPGDEVLGWDFPRIREIARRQGKPVLALRQAVDTAAGCAAVQAEMEHFITPMATA